MDKQGGNPIRGTKGLPQLHEWTNSEKTVDLWRTKHPKIKQYTWSNADNTISTRIDRVYVSATLTEKAEAKIVTCPLSDQDAVVARIHFPNENLRGPGIWKLNSEILTDKSYQHEMNSFLDFWCTQKNSHYTISDWWHELKEHTKRISIKHSVRRAKKKNGEKRTLLEQLDQLKNAVYPDETTITAKEQQLAQKLEEDAKGSIIRSRAIWHEQGEQPTRYFFGLEKKKQQKHTITALRTQEGQVTSDMDILHEAKRFYQTLYTKETTNTDIQDRFLDNIEMKLSVHNQSTCEGPLTTAELTNARNWMHNNKLPGKDGLPVEFYKTFWNKLANPLTEVMNWNYTIAQMSPSQREALLKLLYKNAKDLLKNWRPISLLNVDYKITTKALSIRLRKVLPTIVHPDQTCGIPGRSIHENIMKIRDVIHKTDQGSKVIVISVDQEKAFHRVDRGYLYKVLEAMNFGPSFIQWIRTLYNSATAEILNNGWLSDPVILERGLRQGCPLSPLLYILTEEPLAQTLRENPAIKGIHTPGGAGRDQTCPIR